MHEAVTITYQSEHGEVPKPDTVTKYYPTWYWADEGFYTPHPQMISRGINDNADFSEDVYHIPAVLVQNYASERYYIIVFDFDDVNNRRIKFWDNGDNTFRLYITNGDTVTWCAASVELEGFPTEKPTFEEIASLMTPVKGSCTTEVGSSTYLSDDNGEIATTENYNYEKNDWLIIWASDFIKYYGSPADVYDRGYTPESSEPYYALIPADFLPPMEADGYTFKGWSLNGELIEGNYPIDNDVTLTAVWEISADAEFYTITYVTERGIAPESKTVITQEGESYVLTEADLPALKVRGCIFKRWTYCGETASVGMGVSSNITLTAEWEAVTIKPYITFASGDGFTLAVYNATKNWNGVLEWSTDTSIWNEWDGTTTLSSAEHNGEQRLYLSGTGNSWISKYSASKDYRFILTGSDVRCEGSIETLLDYDTVQIGGHPTMSSYAYYGLFYGCTSLTTAPDLPATKLATSCYQYMFHGCTSLTTAPELPATTLADYCYSYMFYGCKSLTTAPELPATKLADGCYL
jgi:hypothetical protein